MGDIKPGKFDLPRVARNAHIIQKPVIKGSMVFKLKSAYGMCYPFECIGNTMCKIIHGVDTPFISCPVVFSEFDPVYDRISHIDIRRSHIDLRSKDFFTLFELTFSHTPEQVHIFVCAPAAPGAVCPLFSQSPPVLPDLIGGEIIHVCKPLLNEFLGKRVKAVIIIRCVVKMFSPVKTQPLDDIRDGIDIFLFFFFRICIIKPEVASSFILLSQSEI